MGSKIIKEEWKTIIEFPNYDISNFGVIRRGLHTKKGWRTFPGKILLQTINNGYHYVFLMGNKSEGEMLAVHQLVLRHFSAEIQLEGQEPHHKDHDRGHNHISNLEWKSISSNRGLLGEKNNGSKLKEGEVWLIMKLLDNKISSKFISKMFKISPSTVQRIKGRSIWSNLDLSEFKNISDGRTKLKEGEIWLMKRLLYKGICPFKVSKMFRVYPSTAQRMKSNNHWKSITI